MLRSEDGGESHAPAFLQRRSEVPAAVDAEAAPAPKKRGRPPKAKPAPAETEEA